ncbi:MAG: CDGSH iron-sulfur domain-containing protein [Gemmatimonadota bacterium]
MADASLCPTENGPYHVKGGIKLVLSDGTELEAGDETWLCRCGHSRMKPFCDGSHKGAGFASGNDDMRGNEG